MPIELWDDRSGNAIEDFDTEEEALAFVRTMLERGGESAVAEWALDFLDDRPLIRGCDLARRAQLARA